jgi:hypothetical protein
MVLQVAPMIVWLAVAYGLIGLLLRFIPSTHPSGHAPAETPLAQMVLVLLGLPFLLLPILSLWASTLRTVATDGTNLLITLSTGRTATVPLTSIVDVRERRGIDLRTVKITFDRKTKAGRSVRFLAPTRFTVARGEAHPVVLALQDTVEAAQSGTTVNGLPPLLTLPRPNRAA